MPHGLLEISSPHLDESGRKCVYVESSLKKNVFQSEAQSNVTFCSRFLHVVFSVFSQATDDVIRFDLKKSGGHG